LLVAFRRLDNGSLNGQPRPCTTGDVTRADVASYPQRRFASEADREAALREVGGRGLDPAGMEDTGRYYADFHLSRPAAEAPR
jgi:hypothetical protein